MSFDLSVWALPAQGHARGRAGRGRSGAAQGRHADRDPDPRVVRLLRGAHRRISRPARPGRARRWAVTPLHAAADHVEMNLDATCADQVLLDIERLAGEHGLMLLDPRTARSTRRRSRTAGAARTRTTQGPGRYGRAPARRTRLLVAQVGGAGRGRADRRRPPR